MTHYHIPLKDLLAQVAIDDLGGYSTHHVCQALGGVTRSRVNHLAKRYRWRIVGKLGRMNVYHKEDVERYLDSREE